MQVMIRTALSLLLCLLPAAVFADLARPIDVAITKVGMTWRMDVTIQHPDTGWEHFADGWEVLDANGNRLGYRELMHPHVDEQPFTRSLSSLVFPDGTREVFVRTHCSVDGWSDRLIRVALQP